MVFNALGYFYGYVYGHLKGFSSLLFTSVFPVLNFSFLLFSFFSIFGSLVTEDQKGY